MNEVHVTVRLMTIQSELDIIYLASSFFLPAGALKVLLWAALDSDRRPV